MITSARRAAISRLTAGAAATVMIIGRVFAAVKNGVSQSSRQDREMTAMGSSAGP
jgi:hypothetical protein